MQLPGGFKSQEVVIAGKKGGYVGYIPDLKGCITQAKTTTELVKMLA